MTDVIDIDRPVETAHAVNRAAWDDLAATWYAERLPERLARLRDGTGTLEPLEVERLTAQGLRGQSVVHLQCADGSDTLDILRLGAGRVIGVDFAPTMIEHARWLSKEFGGEAAHWHVADVVALPGALTGAADLVYTGKGAIMWVHDLKSWACNIRRLLQPGGRLVVIDHHPVGATLRLGAAALRPTGRACSAPSNHPARGQSGRGALRPRSPQTERVWPLRDVVQAVLDTGIVITRLSEHVERVGNDAVDPADGAQPFFPRTFLLEGRVPGQPPAAPGTGAVRGSRKRD